MRQMKRMDVFEEMAIEVRRNIKQIWDDIEKWD